MDDRELLEAYARNRSEAAFGELVRRHLAWVYSVALRHCGNAGLAEDVAQSVFVLLARKVGGLRSGTVLAGWLFQTTRFVVNRALRAEQRRKRREQTAASMIPSMTPLENDDALWQELAPHLDQAVAALSEVDRTAILLRFYEKQPLVEVGRRLGLSEDAAKKRVSRAIEKLRIFLTQRRVAVSAAMLAGLLVHQTVQAIPAAMTNSVCNAALAGLATPSALSELARDTLQAWRWARVKLAAGIAALSVVCLVFTMNMPPWHRQKAVSPLATTDSAREPGNPKGPPAKTSEAPMPAGLPMPAVLFAARDAATDIPISQAEIHVNYAGTGGWSRRDDLATDAQGACSVPIPEGVARLDIGVLKDGYEERFATWRTDLGDVFPVTYVMRLRKAFNIGGLVRDEAGKPFPGAEIVVRFFGTGDSSGREPVRERAGFINELTVTQTDAIGNWACSVVPSDCTHFGVSARHPGFVSASTSVSSEPPIHRDSGDLTIEDLQARRSVLILRPARSITGLVVDDQGHPVADAEVWAGSEPDARTVTDQSGRFALPNLDGVRPVTVIAPGFATDQQEGDPLKPSPALEFRLVRAPLLRIQVVDESGQPVPGADVALDNWWGKPGNLDFRRPTDADGRLEWLSPPKGELEFCGLKSGYRYSRNNKFTADGQEHTVVLRGALTVSGSVTDAETGAPLESFRVVPGYSQTSLPLDTAVSWVSWERSDRRFGTNGLYRMVLTEEGVPTLQIEADGYEVARAEPQFNGSIASCDFQLRRLDTNHFIEGTVFLPDGNPAPGIEVALCTYECGVMLEGTTFQRGLFGNSGESVRDYRCKTGPDGGFKFFPKPRAHTVVAVGPTGLGKVRCYEYHRPLEIRLQAWGRISGVVRARDNQWAGRRITWSSRGELFDGKTLFYAPSAVATTSDADGNFILENVPPGNGYVWLAESTTGDRCCQTPVEVPTGGTVQVQLGGIGIPISGKLVAPPGIEVRNWTNQVQSAELHSEWVPLPVPPGLTGEVYQRWRQEWWETEAGAAWSRQRRTYILNIQPDGSFGISEALPGKYRLSIQVREGALGSGAVTTPFYHNRQIAWLDQTVVVPEPSATAALELGELVLRPTEHQPTSGASVK